MFNSTTNQQPQTEIDSLRRALLGVDIYPPQDDETNNDQEPKSFARVLGITDMPSWPKNGTVGRVNFCRDVLRQAEMLPVGKALMIEFETRRDREITRPIMYRLIKLLSLPFNVRVMDTLMWVCRNGEQSD